MNPIDVRPEDWGLYYNGTFMWHSTHGLVSISCGSTGFQAYRSRNGEAHNVVPSSLTPLWPEPKAINYGGHAYYIGRRARREARRSATTGHYSINWMYMGSPPARLDYPMFREFATPTPYPGVGEALALLTEDRGSAAITRDIILATTREGRLGVICRGTVTGHLEASNDGYDFIPEIQDSPIARRVEFKLQKEGVLCHST